MHAEPLEARVLLASDLAAGDSPAELLDDVPAQVLSLGAAADGQLTGLNLDGVGDDHGDNASGATLVGVPSTTAGTIGTTNDEDWFQFGATAGVTYTFGAESRGGGGSGPIDDVLLTLYDSTGLNSISQSLAANIVWTAPTTKAYFLSVGPFGSDTGDYWLNSAQSGSSGTGLALRIAQPTLSEGQTSQATVTRNGSNFSAVTVSLFSNDTSEATVPASVTIGAGSNFATFDVAAQNDFVTDGNQAATITASAIGLGNDTATVTVLDIGQTGGGSGDDHGDNAGASTTIGVPSTLSGNIEQAGDTDWFRFTAIAGVTYEFETHLVTLSDSKLRLIDSNGSTILEENDDGGDGFASKITWTPPSGQAGTFYLEVFSFSSSGTGTYTLETSSDGASGTGLALSISQPTLNEGQISQATVTRSGSTGGPLTVSLFSNDTSEVTVPSSVTIQSGSNFATFNVTAQNDFVTDGTQQATITASATGVGSSAATVTVLDATGGGSGDDHGNNAGASTTIGVPSTLSGNIEQGTDTDWFRFTAVAGVTYEFETHLGTLSDSKLRVVDTNGTTVLQENDDGGDGFASKITWAPQSGQSGTYYLVVLPFNSTKTGTYTLETSSDGVSGTGLALSISQPTLNEGQISQATVTRSGSTGGPLTVSLFSNDTSEVTVQSSVTIQSGSNFATFNVTAQNDFVTDGTQQATITASATGVGSSSATVTVLDATGGGSGDDHGNNAGASTTIGVPSTLSGNIEQGTDTDWFRFTAVAGVTYEFETHLDTLTDSRLRLVDTNGTTVLRENDDGGDGFASKITWTPPSGQSGTYYLVVLPFNSTKTGTYTLETSSDGVSGTGLALSISQPTLNEGQISQATVTRSGSTGGPLTVSLFSNDTSEVTVPSSVTIQSGSNFATFNVTAQNDFVTDGNQQATVTASATGVGSSSATVTVLDATGGGSGDDHGNNASTSTTIGVPSTLSGNIETGTDSDWFRFSAVAGVTYEFETHLDTLPDSKLRLVDTNGTTILDEDDDGGDGLASLITWTPSSGQTGTYYLVVLPFSSSNTGTYTLETTSDGVSGTGLGLTITQPTLNEGQISQATVTRSGSTGSPLTVSLVSNDTSEATVPSLVTIQAGSNFATFDVTAQNDFVADGNRQATITASASGLGSTAATVTVLDTQSGGGGGDDHGNNTGTATPIGVPATLSGNIEQPGDTDWFRFTAIAGVAYEFETHLDGTLTLSDSVLRLIDSTGTATVAFNDDGGVGRASKITWTPESNESGTHYLEVSSFNPQNTGTYRLETSAGGVSGTGLVLTIAPPSVIEGLTTQATVTRSGATASAVTVILSSNDPSEATVPISVTIPAGFSSAPFTVAAANDFVIDGTQTSTISASAAGIGSATATVTVLDNGITGGGVDQGGDASSAMTVGVPSITWGELEPNTDVDWFSFFASEGTTYVIETQLFTLFDSVLRLIGRDGVTEIDGNDDGGDNFASKLTWTPPANESGNYYVEVSSYSGTIPYSGTYSLGISVDGTQSTDLDLVIGQPTLTEGQISQASVRRTGSTANSLTVSLSSNDTSEATVPSTVTIGAGSNVATFDVTAQNDFVADGNQSVTITASASGLESDSAIVTVVDTGQTGGGGGDDHGNNAGTATPIGVPTTVPGNIEQGTDTDWFRFTAVAGVTYEFETHLGTLSDSKLQLINANGTTVEFNDDGGDGLASKITWMPGTNESGTYFLEVSPYNTSKTGTYTLETSSDGVSGTGLTLNISPPTLNEGQSSQATVTRTGSAGNLTVSLFSNDTSEATVPATVTIFNGSNIATFNVSAVNDFVADGNQQATITASASGVGSSAATVTVLDVAGGGSGDDHGNNSGAATTIGVPSTLSGNIELGTDTDWFRFTAVAGVAYEFETHLGTLGDSKLRLIDTNGSTILEENDDGGEGFASLITWTPESGQSGTYYLVVLPFNTSNTGTYTLETSSDGVPGTGLGLVISQPTLNEGQISQATVTRSGSTGNSLTVSLFSDDTSEATVPSSVTISAGSNFATFNVTAQNDLVADGNQQATITASASGVGSSAATVTVLDVAGGGSGDDHGNNSGAATTIGVPSTLSGNIEQGTDTDWFRFTAVAGVTYEFETHLGTLDDSKLRLIDTNGSTILDENDDGGEGFASKITSWTPPSGQSGTYYLVVLPFSASDTGTYTLETSSDGVSGTGLVLSISQPTLNEGQISQATVTRSGSTGSALTVGLFSNDTSEATVPSSVTISAGSNFATFDVTAQNDFVTDGNQQATITASASGVGSAAATVTVLDASGGGGGDDHGNSAGAATTIGVPATLPGNIEQAGDTDWFRFSAVAGVTYEFETHLDSTLTLSDSVLRLIDRNGVTTLASNDDGGAGSASKITSWTAPAGQSGTYFLEVFSFISSGTGTYTLETSSNGASGTGLSLNIPQPTFSEGQITQATVSRTGSTGSALTVNLSSSDTSEAMVPTSVTILAGSNFVAFNVTGQNDFVVDGNQPATITASAGGFGSAATAVTVLDNGQTGGGGSDHGDDAATATSVGIPSTTAGTISPNGDVDWFRINTTSGVTYTFETHIGTVQDTVLRLFDENGVLVVADDDGGEGLASSITRGNLSGTYFLEVASYDNSTSGTYTLETSSDGVPTTGLVLSIAQTTLAEGQTSQATVTRSGPTTSALTVILKSADASEATVPATVTIDVGQSSASFTVTAENDSLLDGNQSALITASASGVGNDLVTVTVLDVDGGVPVGDDHGNNAATSTFVGVPSVTTGNIEPSTDSDWFRFNATAGTTYVFETFLDTLFDSTLRLVDTDGTSEVDGNDDGGENNASKIEWTVPEGESGSYYLVVASYIGSIPYTGTYSLQVAQGSQDFALDSPDGSAQENLDLLFQAFGQTGGDESSTDDEVVDSLAQALASDGEIE